MYQDNKLSKPKGGEIKLQNDLNKYLILNQTS